MRLTTTQPTRPHVRRLHTTNPDSAAGHSCIHLARRDTFHPGAENTTKQASGLYEKEALSHLEHYGFGWECANRKTARTTCFVFSTPAHPLRLKSAASGFLVQQGTKTMTTATPTAAFQGNTPVQFTTVISRHQAIENALSMALFHIRKGDTQQDIHSAMAKAIRATSLLKQSCSDLFSGSV